MEAGESTETSHPCGHLTITGGTFDDPEAIYSEHAGKKKFFTSDEDCDVCKEGGIWMKRG